MKFTRPYLIHAEDGRVVWAQKSAYQDTPGLAMWCDLIVKPARLKSGRDRWALIWDNCAAHPVKSVLDVFEEAGISVFTLPPNMTDILQPVDIVPNGPIKTRMRRARALALYSYFQDWRAIAQDAETEHRALPVFDPPAPTLGEGIALVSDIYAKHFVTAEYMAGVRRCFVSVGLSRNAEGTFEKYVSHHRGKVLAKEFRGILSQSKKDDELDGGDLVQDFEFVEAFGQDDSDKSEAERREEGSGYESESESEPGV